MKFTKLCLPALLIFVWISSSINAQKTITLEDLWVNYSYVARSVPGFNFMQDGKHYTRLERNVLKKYDITNGKWVEDLLDGNLLKGQSEFNGSIESYIFSSDESKILITSSSEQVYRHSSKAITHLYDRNKKSLTHIFPTGKIINPEISPDGNKVAFVYDNNLYYQDLNTGKITQITKDGKKNSIINGMCDWVYEEEFSFTQAYQWSPDSRSIAFIRFDESKVPEFTMLYYQDEMYPVYETFKYPKVGENNSDVSVHNYDLTKNKVTRMDIGNLNDMYVPRIKWTQNPGLLCIFKLNRHQNHLQMYLADRNTGKSTVLMEEKNKYYIEINDDLTFLKDGKHFVRTSESEGYNRIYLHTMDGKVKTVLNKGEYDVTAFYGVDETNGKVFFQAAYTSPMQKQVFSVDLTGENLKLLTPAPGTHRAQFSATYDYFINTHSTINSAPSYTIYNRKADTVRVIEDNAAYNKIQNDHGVRDIEFFEFTTSENVKLNGWMLKPHRFNPLRKYPVFMTQYSGPGSQSVNDSWMGQNYWWYQMLAQNGYIVVCVDGRGTGARGEEFRKMTYLQLGHYETLDQIETARYLGSLPYVDKDRIGIYGWSYGGFMSTLCILKGNDVFKAAIAVAPVISWKWYDSIYTERYMRTLAENESGYRNNSPFYFADRLKGHYLIAHGEADDNVHYQNAAEMVNALIAANKQFDMVAYPNRNHGIGGKNGRIHLYTKMTNFIFDNL
jgi:dipeptidyl-peptidase-4